MDGPLGMWLLYVGIGLVVMYLGWGVALLLLQPRLLYRPVKKISFTPGDLGLDFEDVTFDTADGVPVTGWYVPVDESRFTILFCHGNAGNIMHCLDTIRLLHDLGISSFIFDYRGFGNSGGRPSEIGTYQDARAAYDWLTQTRGVPAEQVVLFGRSLGGSIAAHLAGRVRAAGLVIESAFSSYSDIGAKFYPYMPVRSFAGFKYDTVAHMAAVKCPVLVMHSRHDAYVPFEFGTRIFDAANEPKRFVEILGGHNHGFLISGDIYKEAWLKWLDSVESGQCDRIERAAS